MQRLYPGLSFPALLAGSVQLQLVRLDEESVAVGHLSLEFFDCLVLELDDAPTAGADQMVVVLPFGHVLIPGLAVAEMDLIGDPRLGEQLQCAVDRGVADARVLGPQLQVELLDAHVALGGEEHIKDDVPLAGLLQPLAGDELMEYFFLGFFHRAPPIESDFHVTYRPGPCQRFFSTSSIFLTCRSRYIFKPHESALESTACLSSCRQPMPQFYLDKLT